MRNSPKTMRVSLISGFSRRLFVSTSLAMILAASLSLIITVVHFNASLRPYLVDKARAVAVSVQQDIEYAISIGIPFDKIRGLDKHIESLIKEHPEVRAMQVVSGPEMSAFNDMVKGDTENNYKEVDYRVANLIVNAAAGFSTILSSDGSDDEMISVAVVNDGIVFAHVVPVIDENYLNGKMTSVFFDTLVILIAVSLVALEIVVVLSASQLSEPFRVAELALNRRAAGDLRQYQSGTGNGRLANFIRTLNTYNATLRDKLKSALDSVKDVGRREKLSELSERSKLFVTDARQQASIMDARIPLFVFALQKSCKSRSCLCLWRSSTLKMTCSRAIL